MLRPAADIYQFHLGRTAHRRARWPGFFMLACLLTCAILFTRLAIIMWHSYSHELTFYLKWQDAVTLALGALVFILCGGSIFVLRFLVALHSGHTRGMIILRGNHSLSVRDLSIENYWSILWVMHTAFWCFMAVIVGLLPWTLLGWALHLSHPVLAVLATILVGLLMLAGLVLSIGTIVGVVAGCIGVISFCRNLGGQQTYELSSHSVMRIDDNVLTVVNPGAPETMLDLVLLNAEDRHILLSLLHERWINAQRSWSPTLGEEIAEVLARTHMATGIG